MAIKTIYREPDTCTCIFEYQYNDADNPVVHTISKVIRACTAHQGRSAGQLFDAVIEENGRKNDAAQGILDNGPAALYDVDGNGSRLLKNGITLFWTWSGIAPNRVLTLSYSGITLTTPQKNAAQNWLNNRFGDGKVTLQ